MSHPEETSPITSVEDPQYAAASHRSSPAAMAWLDRSIRTLLRTSNPGSGIAAAAEARDAARALARTLGTNEVPLCSVERRIEALVRLDIPNDHAQAPQRRRIVAAQLLTWASEAYHEARMRLRRPADLP